MDRETELTQLHGWLNKARHGERQVVCIGGEPGIGKTALVEVFMSEVRSPNSQGERQKAEGKGQKAKGKNYRSPTPGP